MAAEAGISKSVVFYLFKPHRDNAEPTQNCGDLQGVGGAGGFACQGAEGALWTLDIRSAPVTQASAGLQPVTVKPCTRIRVGQS